MSRPDMKLRYRCYFSESEADNLFYEFCQDHCTGYLWDEEKLEAVAKEHLGDASDECRQLRFLMRRGYLNALRCLRLEAAPYAEKERLQKHIGKAISDSDEDRDGLRAYLDSFCNAIDYYSEKDKENKGKKNRHRSLICMITVLLGTVLLCVAVHAFNHPEECFPVSHMYVSGRPDQGGLIDVSYQFNKLKSIAFYDRQGNLKTKLSELNEWGESRLVVQEQAEDDGGRFVYFQDGASVPFEITENKGDTVVRTIVYRSDGLIDMISDENGDMDIPDGRREIYYHADGTGLTVRITDGSSTKYSGTRLEPLYRYVRTIRDDDSGNSRQIIYRDKDGSMIESEDIRFLRKNDDEISVIKRTLGNGTVLSHYIVLSGHGYCTIDYPS